LRRQSRFSTCPRKQSTTSSATTPWTLKAATPCASRSSSKRRRRRSSTVTTCSTRWSPFRASWPNMERSASRSWNTRRRGKSSRRTTLAVLNPEHLFEQAERLIVPPPAGPPRQVDLRRAISAAYYGLFHALLTAVGDELIGKTKRNTLEYGLAYRTLDHRRLLDLCSDVKKPDLPKKLKPYAPAEGFGPEIQALAPAVIELQEKRHSADYDPMSRVKTADALLAVELGGAPSLG